MEWISVHDGLPENDNKVLVYFKEEITLGRYLYSGIDKSKHIFGIQGFGQTLDVTHWSPIEPPKS